MEPESSLPHSQEPATCPYCVQDVPVYKTLAATPGKNGSDCLQGDVTSEEGNWKVRQDWCLQ